MTGLVLEGGAIRAVYTAGVLDVYDGLSGYCTPLYETRYITIFSNESAPAARHPACLTFRCAVG